MQRRQKTPPVSKRPVLPFKRAPRPGPQAAATGDAEAPPRRTLGRFGLPVRRVPQARGLDDLQREQRALQARGGDVDPQQLEHELTIELEQLLDRPSRSARRRSSRPRPGRSRSRGRRTPRRRPSRPRRGSGALARLSTAGSSRRTRGRESRARPSERVLVVLEDVLSIEVVHLGEHLLHRPEAFDQTVDVLARDVHGERGPRRRRRPEAAHQRLGAVVAGAHAHVLAAEDLRDVVRVGRPRARRRRAAAESRSVVRDVSPGVSDRRSSA